MKADRIELLTQSPMHSHQSDLLFSLFPLILLVYLMAKKRSVPAHIALPLCALLLYIVKLIHFGTDSRILNATVIQGLLTAWTPILIIWGAVLLFFHKKSATLSPELLPPAPRKKYLKSWMSVIAIIFIICIPLSRLYLGRHFLADVLAGFLVGFTVLFLFYKFIYRNEKLTAWLFKKTGSLKLNLKTIFFAAYCLLLPFLLLLIPQISMTAAPVLLGLNCGFFFRMAAGTA